MKSSQTLHIQIHPNSNVPPVLQLDILKDIVPQAQVVLNLISHGGPSSLWRENIGGRDVHHTPATDPNETNCRDDLQTTSTFRYITSCREPGEETLLCFSIASQLTQASVVQFFATIINTLCHMASQRLQFF